MKQGWFLGILAIASACAAFAGCTTSSYGGGSGGGASPTPPIPAGDYYVNGGQNANQVYGFSTSPIAAGGLPVGLSMQPYSTGKNGATGAPFGLAFALNNTVLYVSNYDDSSVTIFPVNGDGSLNAASATTVPVGTNPSGLCVDPTSSFLVVVNTGSNAIQSF